MDEPIHPVQLEAVAALYAAGIQLRVAGLRMTHPEWTDDQLESAARRSLRHAGT